MKQAPESLQRLAKRAGFHPVAVSAPRRPGRPQGARDGQQRVRLAAQESWEAALEMMRERWGSGEDHEREKYGLEPLVVPGLVERRDAYNSARSEDRMLAVRVLENEKERYDAVMRQAEPRRYRKGPKPAPMLVRRRKA